MCLSCGTIQKRYDNIKTLIPYYPIEADKKIYNYPKQEDI